MTIRKGSGYGTLRPLPPGAPIATSDVHLCRLVADTEPGSANVFGLIGGDLCRTLGGLGDVGRLTTGEAVTVPIDLAIATIDGRDHPFVAHLVVGRPFGPNFAAVMNAQWFGDLDLGPRAHPGDGLLDITTGSLRWRQRRLAVRRARSGIHVPHPALRQRRTANEVLHVGKPVPVLIDGGLRTTGSEISIRLERDAFEVVI